MTTNFPPSAPSDDVTHVASGAPKINVLAGKFNTLTIVKQLDFGVYLDGGSLGEILMPTKWVPEGKEIGDEVEVFIYFDSSDRPIATTMKPKACVDEVAFLMCKQVNTVGVDGLGLADAMAAVNGLRLDGGIPPRIVKHNVAGGGEI